MIFGFLNIWTPELVSVLELESFSFDGKPGFFVDIEESLLSS